MDLPAGMGPVAGHHYGLHLLHANHLAAQPILGCGDQGTRPAGSGTLHARLPCLELRPEIALPPVRGDFLRGLWPRERCALVGVADVAALVAASARAVLSSPDQISFVRTTSSTTTWRHPAGGRSTS
eukprot:3113262-Prymnesium_polylepis.1